MATKKIKNIREQGDEADDPYDQPTGVNPPTLANSMAALASFPEDEVGEGTRGEDALQEAMRMKSPTDYRLEAMGTSDLTEQVDTGTLLGADIGYKSGGETGAMIGATVGGVLGRSLSQVQSGENDATSKYSYILRGMSDKNGQPLLSFEDGTMLPIPTDPNEEVNTFAPSILTGKGTKKAYELDETNPIGKKTYKMVKPVAEHIVQDLYGFSVKKDKSNARVLEYVTGSLAQALLSDSPTSKVVEARLNEMALKLRVPKRK